MMEGENRLKRSSDSYRFSAVTRDPPAPDDDDAENKNSRSFWGSWVAANPRIQKAKARGS